MNAITLGARRGWVVALIAVTLVLSTLGAGEAGADGGTGRGVAEGHDLGLAHHDLRLLRHRGRHDRRPHQGSSASTPRSCSREQNELGPKLKAALPATRARTSCSPTST